MFKQKTLEEGVIKTKNSFFSKLTKAIIGKSSIDEAILDKIEESLIAADVGVATTLKIIEHLQKKASQKKYTNLKELSQLLQESIIALLPKQEINNSENFSLSPFRKPQVLLVVGVNGVGKTTTIAKIAAQYKKRDYKVMLGAADTFRAAAIEQLEKWGERIEVPVISRNMHTDPSSVAYITVKEGIEKQADLIIIDTAGRLHTKVHLINELAKIKRVINKLVAEDFIEVLLVLDGSIGQNSFSQAKAFLEAIKVNSLAITKIDGTAKGGIVISISDQFNLPIKYLGLGEGLYDLQIFDQNSFVKTLFSLNNL